MGEKTPLFVNKGSKTPGRHRTQKWRVHKLQRTRQVRRVYELANKRAHSPNALATPSGHASSVEEDGAVEFHLTQARVHLGDAAESLERSSAKLDDLDTVLAEIRTGYLTQVA